MNSVRSNNLSLKYQRFTPSDWKDIGIRKFDFVAKTQFIKIEDLNSSNDFIFHSKDNLFKKESV